MARAPRFSSPCRQRRHRHDARGKAEDPGARQKAPGDRQGSAHRGAGAGQPDAGHHVSAEQDTHADQVAGECAAPVCGSVRPERGRTDLHCARHRQRVHRRGAEPLIITLSTEAGRQSAQYDFAALDELYGQYGSLLAQALESAETPQACTRTEFYAALRGTGAAFCFPGAISPSVLGAWLNVRAPEGGQAQWYVLAQEEDGVTLYLAGEQFSAAKTALPAQSLTAQLETAVPDGSFFAFEAGAGALCRAGRPLAHQRAERAGQHRPEREPLRRAQIHLRARRADRHQPLWRRPLCG